MIDRIPEVFRYVRLIENRPVVATQYELLREDGSIETITALNSTINKSIPLDVSEEYFGKVKYDDIEILASDIEEKRIEKIIRMHVNEDIPQFKEVRNSLVILYNGLIDDVVEYHNHCKVIKGTGIKIGRFETMPDYYREIRQCFNKIKNGCNGIELSVTDGEIIKAVIIDKRNNRIQLPKFEDNSELKSLECRLHTLWFDPKHKFENIRKFTLRYTPKDDFLYTFEEVQNNVVNYLQAQIEKEIMGSPTKNPSRQKFYKRLDCIYRYVMNNPYIELKNGKSKTDVLEFIVEFLKIQGNEVDNRKYNYVDLVTMGNYVGQSAETTILDIKINPYKSIRKKLGKLNNYN